MTEHLTGAQLRDRGVADSLAADHAVHRDHAAAVRDVLDRFVAAGQIFDADAIRDALPEHVRGVMAPNLLGALIRTAAVRGEIRLAGYAISARRSRHAGVLRRWVRSDVELEAAA